MPKATSELRFLLFVFVIFVLIAADSCTQTARLVAGNIQTQLRLGEFLFEVSSLCH